MPFFSRRIPNALRRGSRSIANSVARSAQAIRRIVSREDARPHPPIVTNAWERSESTLVDVYFGEHDPEKFDLESQYSEASSLRFADVEDAEGIDCIVSGDVDLA